MADRQRITVEAFDASYRSLFADLVRLCGVLGAIDDADDIAQDVLVDARRHLSALREPTHLKAWVRRMTVRAVSRRRGRPWATTLDAGLAYVPGNVDLEIDLAAAVARLPDRERVILSLVYGLGYRQEEVADALHIRRGTVAATLFHARKKLAGELIDYRRK